MLGREPAEPARSRYAKAPMLTLAEMSAFRDAYLAGAEPPPGTFILDEPDLSGLPPTLPLPIVHDLLSGRTSAVCETAKPGAATCGDVQDAI